MNVSFVGDSDLRLELRIDSVDDWDFGDSLRFLYKGN